MKAKGYEDYLLVSSEGRVRSVDRTIIRSDGRYHNHPSKLKKLIKRSNGYLKVDVCDTSKGLYKQLSVHRLVATTFIPNLENKPTVNHKDGNKLNNSVDNLEWATYSEQQLHAFNTGLKTHKGENSPTSKLREDDVRFIRESNLKGVELAKMFNISRQNISDIKRRKTWKHI